MFQCYWGQQSLWYNFRRSFLKIWWLFAGEIMKKARFNVIDVSFTLQAQTMRRNRDGIHWSSASNRLYEEDWLLCWHLGFFFRLITNITLTHLTLTLPQFGPQCLPGMMKNSLSLTNLIRLKMKKQRKSSTQRKSLELGGYNPFQQPFDGGSPWFPGYNSYHGSEYLDYQQQVSPHLPFFSLWPTPPQHFYSSSPWVQPQQRIFQRRRESHRFRNRYHPYWYWWINVLQLK